MASYLERLRRLLVTGGSVDPLDLRRLLDARSCLDQENDELRRENERLLKALAPTVAPPAAPEPEMCCGGTCVRAVCFIHGAGNG